MIIGSLFGLGLSALFLSATDADSYPERLARSFTTTTKTRDTLHIQSTWLFMFLVAGPALPIIVCIFLAGVFDHSFFPNRPGHEPIYTSLGVICGIGLLYIIPIFSYGFRCDVSEKHVVWVSTYFGKDARVREYINVRIVEYALTNGAAGGPVVTIEHDKEGGGRSMSKLKFRNLYECSREEFGDLLTEFLGEPERRTIYPTKNGHQPVLAEPTE